MASVTVVKSILLIVMAIVTVISVLLPFCVMRIPFVKNITSDRRKFILSVCNCFGGGVFVATGFLHLLTESNEKMDEAIQELIDNEVDYPFAHFVVCIGFLLVLIIENIAISCKPADQEEASEPIVPLCRSDSTLSVRMGSPREIDGKKEETTEFAEGIHLMKNPNLKNTSKENYLFENGDVKIVTKKSNLSYFHAFTVALALSIHSIFEGLALGLEEESNEVFKLFAAIIIHKTILAFSMGINFVTVQVALKSSLLLTAIFALASPIGGGVGIALAASNGESLTVTVLNAILLSLATGTFLFIAFIEVIGYELINVESQHHKHRLVLILAILLGFSVFAGVSFVPSHSHDGHDHHDH